MVDKLSEEILSVRTWHEFRELREHFMELDFTSEAICEHLAELAMMADDDDQDDVIHFCAKHGIGRWYKENENSEVWWLDIHGVIGEHIFSFDKVERFNLSRDFPYKLNREQVEIFVRENPSWGDFFRSRLDEWQNEHK